MKVAVRHFDPNIGSLTGREETKPIFEGHLVQVKKGVGIVCLENCHLSPY
jgi:hypothetical protein